MPLFTTSHVIRPNRLESAKDKKYHSDYAKWCLNVINHPLYRKFVSKTLINWSFFKGNDGQWIFDEDLESFFLDESGDVRNRIKMTKNLILPMVAQYEGNAIRLSYRARAKSMSDVIINRREEELSRLKFFQKASENFPDMEELIKDRFVVGDSEAETEEIFENSWVETHEKDINNLLTYIEEQINIDELKVRLSRQLAISGLGVYKAKEHNLEYTAEVLDSLFYFWDLSAREADLSDSEYMGDWYYSDTASLFERYQQLTRKEREALEKYSVDNSANSNTLHKLVNNFNSSIGSKIPVYDVYWRDVDEQEYGWVEDKWGYPMFLRINSEDNDFTDKDLIEPPEQRIKSPIAKGDKKCKIFVDLLRYCTFTPSEEIEFDVDDIVYEYGVVPYQETYMYSPSNIRFPYKAYALFYDKGDVLSPIDNVISPQRFINRLISVVESQVNNSRGSGTIIDRSAVDPKDGEAEVIRNMNKSKPVFVDTARTGSVQNAVGQYGNNINQGILSTFQIINELQTGIQDVTGVNESMQGTDGASDKLVGVVEAQIQRGSLLQEPFYWALSSILKQAYEHMASVGKQIYLDNPRRLSIAVGDEGMQHIMITEDIALDDFRIKIERIEDEATLIEKGNQQLLMLVQGGLINQDNFKLLLNRATPDMISDALRDEVKLNRLKEIEQAKLQPQQAAQEEMAAQGMMEQQQGQEQAAMDNDNEQKGLDREAKSEDTVVKEFAKNEREKLKYQNK